MEKEYDIEEKAIRELALHNDKLLVQIQLLQLSIADVGDE
jgi:hypothetical protein